MRDTTLAILAGGEGSRMGTPKGQLRVGDQPILGFLLDRFAWEGPTLLVTAPGREHPPAHERFSAEAVDPVPGLGPLRGVLTALEHAATDELIIATVDMPGISRVQLDWLLEQGHSFPESHALLIERMLDDEPTIEPFPSFWRKSSIPFISRKLDQHRRSVHGMLSLPGFAKIPSHAEWDAKVWINLNHPVDFEAFLSGEM